jgi:hypothetical protein
MPFDAPFKLGPFTVDAEGRLSPLSPEAPPAVLFRWRDRVMRAGLVREDGSGDKLVLQATLGRVASTAGTRDETLRPRSFALVHWLADAMPAEWRLSLTADHRVRLVTETAIALPITATALLSELTLFLLALAPYLDLLDEVGLSAAPA